MSGVEGEGLSRRKAKKAQKIQAIEKSRSAFHSVDLQVQHTNDDSIISKRSAVLHGYMDDPFLRLFVKTKARRSPLINRGYYLRMKVMTDVVLKCVDIITKKFPGDTIQIISLGAGYDTLAMRCLLQSDRKNFFETHTHFYDVDFAAVMKSKSVLMKAAKPGTFPSDWKIQPEEGTIFIQSPNYTAIGSDLREAKKELLPSLRKAFEGFSPSSYTIIYAECVLQYLPESASSALISHLAEAFPNAVFFSYDQLHPEDSFGKVMMQSLKTRNSPLLGISSLCDGFSMVQRAVHCGMINASFANFYDLGRYYFHPTEKSRLDGLEPFDEEEEWSEMCEHYGVIMGRTLRDFPDNWHPCFLDMMHKNFHAASLSSVSCALQQWPSGRFRFERWGFGNMCADKLADGDVVFIAFGGFCVGKTHGRVDSVYCHSLRRGDLDVISTGDQNPGPLIFHSFTKLSSTRYIVFGGRTNPKNVSRSAYLLTLSDFGNDKTVSYRWDSLEGVTPGPCARFRHTAALCGDESLFIFGGCDSEGNLLGDSWIGDICSSSNTITWRAIALNGDVPRPTCSGAAVYSHGKIYLAGGLGNNYTADEELYSVSVETGKCTRSGSSIGQRYSHSMASILLHGKEYLLILGGSSCNPKAEVERGLLINKSNLDDICSVSLPSDAFSWSRHACVPLDDGVVAVVGGGYTCFSFGTASCRPVLLLLDNSTFNSGTSSSMVNSSLCKEMVERVQATRKLKEVVLSKESFYQAAKRASEPVLFKKVRLGPCVEKWKDPIYLAEAQKDTTVSVHVANDTALDFVHKNFSFRHMSFQEMIQKVVDCTLFYREKGRLPTETLYFRSVSSHMKTDRANLWKDFPTLGEDFSLPEEIKEFIMPRMHQACWRLNPFPLHLWLHYDTLDNVLCQIVGKKKLTLFPPSQYNNLYMVDSSSQVLSMSNPQLEQYPRFLEACKHKMEVILESGDMIFIPALWFHHLETLDSADDYSVSVNVFYEHFPHEMYDTKDLYGNKDVPLFATLRQQIVSRVQSLVDEAANDGSNMVYAQFALREAIQDLEALASSLEARSKAL